MGFEPSEHPHRRYNPLTGEWVLVSPHRARRPWRGAEERPPGISLPAYDATCYLCPGNSRVGGVRNPPYDSTFVFDNDFPALMGESVDDELVDGDGLLRAIPERGVCRVVCFSPEHNLTLAEMPVESIGRVIETWREQVRELSADYRWVQVFENKGAIMGCSNPHPHGQIWAQRSLPNEAVKEARMQRRFFEEEDEPLLVRYARLESRKRERVVVENEDWLVVAPFWAVWPFETLLLPKRLIPTMLDLRDGERRSLAEIMKRLLTKYDNLFECSFPYSMGWHGAPGDMAGDGFWQLHAHYFPPLLRSASVKKFMVGYEMFGESQRDLTPEQAAKRLRELPERHYKRGR